VVGDSGFVPAVTPCQLNFSPGRIFFKKKRMIDGTVGQAETAFDALVKFRSNKTHFHMIRFLS
jgi:hypothetical protein